MISFYSSECIYPTLPPRIGCGTRSIFKLSKAGLNSDFSFETGCKTKANKLSVPYYLSIADGGWIFAFYKSISEK